MGTTSGGLPWPENTDFVTDGAMAIRALAERLDQAATYVPVTSGLVLGNGTITGRWWATARLLMAEVVVTWGSSTTNTTVGINPPPAAVPANPINSTIGHWTAWHPSQNPAQRMGYMVRQSATNAICRSADGNTLSATVPWTWISGCTLIATFSYPLSVVPTFFEGIDDAIEDTPLGS